MTQIYGQRPINWQAVSEYLRTQSRFCEERARDEQSSVETMQSMYLRADIYAVLSQAILVGLGGPQTWPPREEQDTNSKLLLDQ